MYKVYIRLCNLFYGIIYDYGVKCRINKVLNNLLGLIELKFMFGSLMLKFEIKYVLVSVKCIKFKGCCFVKKWRKYDNYVFLF